MSSKRKAGGWHREKRPRGIACECRSLVVRTADGVCDSCGYLDSMTFPPMPSSQGLGDVAEVGWSCPECEDGEVIGLGTVTEVR